MGTAGGECKNAFRRMRTPGWWKAAIMYARNVTEITFIRHSSGAPNHSSVAHHGRPPGAQHAHP
jgi:hypothetical protein